MHVGLIGENAEAVSEADGQVELAVVAVAELVALPAPVCGGVAAQVHGHVPDLAPGAAHQLRLAGIGLEVNPAEDAPCRARVVFLDEGSIHPELAPGFGAEALDQEATLVGVGFDLDQREAVEPGVEPAGHAPQPTARHASFGTIARATRHTPARTIRRVANNERSRPASRHSAQERRLLELSAREHGVVSLTDLRALGFSDVGRTQARAAGRLHRMYPGVFAVGRPDVTREGRWLAAVKAAGEGAVLSHRSAAALHGLRPSSVEADRAHRLPRVALGSCGACASTGRAP